MILALGHTPFHLFFLKVIFKKFWRDYKCHIVYSGKTSEFGDLLPLEIFPYFISNTTFEMLGELKKRFDIISSLVLGEKINIVLLSDLDSPLNCSIAAYFSALPEPPEIYIYMDGLGAYRTDVVSFFDFSKKIIKKLLYAFYNLPYLAFTGQILGQDVNFVKGVFSLDGRKVCGNNPITITFDDIKYNNRRCAGTLYLDQPNDDDFSLDIWKKFNESVVSEIKNKYPAPYYFKTHHRSSSTQIMFFVAQGFVPYDESHNKCIEEMVSSSGLPEVVVAVCSSALINLKDIYGDSVKCFRISFGDLFSYEKNARLINIFNDSKVGVVSLKI